MEYHIDHSVVQNKYNLNNGGMLDWTHSKGLEIYIKQCLEPLQGRKNLKILEVGTYAGISLIGFLELLPRSTHATAIDLWSSMSSLELCTDFDYIEKLFDLNTEKSGVSNRVRKLKGLSSTMLRHLLQKRETFDFIYIDGSHMCLDVLTDIILAWELLKENGIFLLDDYSWKPPTTVKNLPMELCCPKLAIDYFIDNYKDDYDQFGIGDKPCFIKREKLASSIAIQ